MMNLKIINFKHIILIEVENSWTKLTNKEMELSFIFGIRICTVTIKSSEFANFMVLYAY